jgi:hypothetical protein
MLIKVTLFIVLNIFFENVYSQIIKGRIIDSESGKPIPYCGVGVLNKAIGTVSDANGVFALNIFDATTNDTIRFSEIGYLNLEITVAKIHSSDSSLYTYSLTPEASVLNTVYITPKEEKRHLKLGNTVNEGGLFSGFSSNMLGAEIGVVLKYHKENPGRIESLHFDLASSTYDSILFQVNIYDFNDGVIGKSILHRPILLKSDTNKGVLTFNVQDSSVVINQDVLLTLELVHISKKGLGAKNNGIVFYAGLFDNAYLRKSADDVWSKISYAGVGFWADVIYYK